MFPSFFPPIDKRLQHASILSDAGIFPPGQPGCAHGWKLPVSTDARSSVAMDRQKGTALTPSASYYHNFPAKSNEGEKRLTLGQSAGEKGCQALDSAMIRFQVSGPTMPLVVIPARLWISRTAASVAAS